MEQQAALRERLTDNLITLQRATSERPYSIAHRLEIAEAYECLGYPDLAAGDAYKALLLIDEVAEEGEYHEEATAAAIGDCNSQRLASLDIQGQSGSNLETDESVLNWAKLDCSKKAYVSSGTTNSFKSMPLMIEDCENFRSAFDYISRARKAFPDELVFQEHDADLSEKVHSYFKATGQDSNDVDIDDYPDKGYVRREQYPWNDYEPERCSDECLQSLNGELASIAPKLEVKISELPLLATKASGTSSTQGVEYVRQLGVFAKQDISPGECILEEKSLLTAISRLHDSYCDACSLALPNTPDATAAETEVTIISCEECDEVFFCSIECHNLAQDSYHPSLCGVSMDQGTVTASEAADALYTSLLIRALALAETQGLHPLELKEVRYIWGDYHGQNLDEIWAMEREGERTDAFGSVSRTLPFSFKNNVLTPLHMLEKMEVNIFTQSAQYSTWVFNTILAKLRGTASARQGLDGRPEIGAVHPIWCLANHSCDPNVAWDWQGSMRFWTRETLVDWKGRNPNTTPGIQKGEEIFSHYCDVRLPVKERREWAVGALGGECMCPRCIWEDAQELRQRPATTTVADQ